MTTTAPAPVNVTGTMSPVPRSSWLSLDHNVAATPRSFTKSTVVPDVTVRFVMSGMDGHDTVVGVTSGLP